MFSTLFNNNSINSIPFFIFIKSIQFNVHTAPQPHRSNHYVARKGLSPATDILLDITKFDIQGRNHCSNYRTIHNYRWIDKGVCEDWAKREVISKHLSSCLKKIQSLVWCWEEIYQCFNPFLVTQINQTSNKKVKISLFYIIKI